MTTEPTPAASPRRPGAGLRIALYLLLCMVVLQVGGRVLVPLLDPAGFEEARLRGDAAPLGLGVLLAVQAMLAPVLIVLTILFLHFVDRRHPRTIGGGWPAPEGDRPTHELPGPALLTGTPLSRVPRGPVTLGVLLAPFAILGGWALSSVVLADLQVDGWAPEALEGPAWWPGLTGHWAMMGLYLVGFLAASVAQEWMFRGYVYSTVRRRFAWIHAAGLTAVFQVLLQWAPRIDAAALANIFLMAMGVAALRELTGSVWPGAIFSGVWNFVLGCLLSLPISGFDAPRSFVVTVEGDPIWTGGAWGPEGSWSLTSYLLVALVLLVGPLAKRDAESEVSE